MSPRTHYRPMTIGGSRLAPILGGGWLGTFDGDRTVLFRPIKEGSWRWRATNRRTGETWVGFTLPELVRQVRIDGDDA